MPNDILQSAPKSYISLAEWKVIPTLLMGKNRLLFEDCESNVLQFKSSFLKSLLDWGITFVPNFSSFNLVDVNFLDF
jgi:hypothetical protein